jgi:hypothetical protein
VHEIINFVATNFNDVSQTHDYDQFLKDDPTPIAKQALQWGLQEPQAQAQGPNSIVNDYEIWAWAVLACCTCTCEFYLLLSKDHLFTIH